MQHVLQLPESMLPRRPQNSAKGGHKKNHLNAKSQSNPYYPQDQSKKYDRKMNDQSYGMMPEAMNHYGGYQYQGYQQSPYNYMPYYQPGMHPGFQMPQYSPYGQQRSMQPPRGNHFQVPMMVVPQIPQSTQEEGKSQQYYDGGMNLSVSVNYGQHHNQTVAAQPNSAGLPPQTSKRARIGSLQENQRGRL